MDIEKVIAAQPIYTAHGKPSEDTTRAYKRTARFFINWLIQHGRDVETADYNDAAEYVHELYQQGIKREGVNQRIAGARAFFRTAISIGEFTRANPFAEIKGQKQGAIPTTHYFNQDEMRQIFNACNTDRERALILIMGVEGLRTVEVQRMRIKDIDYQNSRIKIHGKGDHDSYIFPSDITLETLKKYIGTRTNGEVFINDIDGGSLTRQGIKWVTNGILKRAGLKKKGVSCHALRHSCGTNLYEATKDIRLVQETLRHQSPEVTARYAHVINRKNATSVIANF